MAKTEKFAWYVLRGNSFVQSWRVGWKGREGYNAGVDEEQ